MGWTPAPCEQPEQPQVVMEGEGCTAKRGCWPSAVSHLHASSLFFTRWPSSPLCLINASVRTDLEGHSHNLTIGTVIRPWPWSFLSLLHLSSLEILSLLLGEGSWIHLPSNPFPRCRVSVKVLLPTSVSPFFLIQPMSEHRSEAQLNFFNTTPFLTLPWLLCMNILGLFFHLSTTLSLQSVSCFLPSSLTVLIILFYRGISS